MGALTTWLSGKKTYLAVVGLLFITIGAFLKDGNFAGEAVWNLAKQIIQDLIPAFIRLGIAKNK